MILKIKFWCEGIIIAIIICIIIESLLPNGNNKKYVKVVIGIYIMFITLNPIFDLLNYDFKTNELFNLEYEEVYSSIDSEIKDVYIVGIEENIKEEIKKLGYDVNYVNVFVDITYENIEKVELKVNSKRNEIKIEIKNSAETDKKDYQDILKFFKENYYLSEEQINFK